MSNTTMKAFAVTEYKSLGELDHLQQFEISKPSSPKGHDVLVKIKAVATNPIDYKRLGNLGNSNAEYEVDGPLVVGWDGAGIVEAVGPGVTLFEVGDEVMFAGDFWRPGTFAEYTLVDERIVGKKPSNISWASAATLSLTSLTAWETLVDQLKISRTGRNEGKTILITAGAGGVGSAAIGIAKKVLGLTVVATASRPETEAFVKERGADFVISHRQAYQPQLDEIGVDKVDYIMHCSDLTPELFTEFTEIVKPFGGIASIWPAATVDLMQLFWKSINFSAELMFTRPKEEGADIQRQHDILMEVSQLVEDGTLTPAMTQEMELTVENLQTALETQASGKAIGKMALTFAE